MILQAEMVDFWRILMEKGGLAGLCLALIVGMGILWRKLEAKDKALTNVYDRIVELEKESVRASTNANILLRTLTVEQSNTEARLSDALRSSMIILKDQIHDLKESITERIHAKRSA